MSRAVGQRHERQARQFLEKKGLRYITSNFSCRLGEIDLIMQDRDTLAFIEVRYRRTSQYGSPADTVDIHKQRKLIRAAEYYLQITGIHDTVPCRFDIVGMSHPHSIEWIQNAFQIEG